MQFLREQKYETMRYVLEHIILLICPICLFIHFSYFLVDDLVSSYGQQLVVSDLSL